MIATLGIQPVDPAALAGVAGGNRLVNVFAPLLRRVVVDGIYDVWRYEPNFAGRALGLTGKQLSRVPPRNATRYYFDRTDGRYTKVMFHAGE